MWIAMPGEHGPVMVFRFLSTLFKIGLASLIAGAILTYLEVSADQVLADIGITPERILHYLQRGIAWALPNITLGAMVVVPVWIVIYLFRPPR